MNDSVTLSTFPSGKIEAIAMLYVQQQDLSGKTPEEIFDLFEATVEQLRSHQKEVRKKARMVR